MQKDIAKSATSIIKMLKKRSFTLCVAESITGGGLGQALTSIPGSSEVFLGGVIAYSEEMKISALGVNKRSIKKFSPCSEEVAMEMAQGVQRLTGADFAIATTGVAGPGKAYEQKAGSVWVAISGAKKTGITPFAFFLELSATRPGLTAVERRDEIRNSTITSALAAFERILIS